MVPLRILSVVVLALSATLIGAAESRPRRFVGRHLLEVLDAMREQGQPLVYSTAVVDPAWVVTVEPTASAPRRRLEELLQPFGLAAVDGPAGSILIVRSGAARVEGAVDPAAPPPHPTSRFLTEVVVTPNRHSVVTEETEATRTLHDDDVVFAPAMGGDVSRVIGLLPGVAAADNSAAFNVRGSTTQDVAMVLDGLELYDPFHLFSFQSPFSLVDSRIVDRIDFIGGGFTSEFGDRYGGFVDIKTYDPDIESRGEVELGTLNSRVAWRAPWKRARGAWLLSARSWYPEAIRNTTELGGGEDLEPHFGDLYAKLVFDRGGRHRASAHALVAHDRLHYRETGEDVNERVRARADNAYLWFRWQSSLPSGLDSESTVSWGRIDRLRSGISSAAGPVQVDDERIVDFVGVQHRSTWRLSDDRAIKAGVDARWLEGQYRYASVVVDDPPLSRSISEDPDGLSMAAYAALRTRVGPRVVVELGARWDRQTYTDDNQLSPRFNAVWRVDGRNELRLALGRVSQSQRIHELQIEDGETDFQRAEVSRQAELSYLVRMRGGVHLRIDAYHREVVHPRQRYENLFEPIELFPETVEDRVRIAPERALLRGVELLLRNEPDRRWTWWASYTRSSAVDEIGGRHVPRSWDQPHAARFLIGYRRSDAWSISLTGSAHTGWPTTPATGVRVTLPDGSTAIEPAPGPRNSDRFDTYARLDLKARRSIALPRGRLWLTFEATNLTDRKNPRSVDDFLFTANPDGSVTTVRVPDHWLGFTPSFSARWEF